MKKYLLILFCLFLSAGSAAAYTQDKVLVLSESSRDSEAMNIANTHLNVIANNLAQRYRCLEVFLKSDITGLVGLKRMQELLGTAEEQSANLNDIGDAMGVKYLILVNVVHDKGNPTTTVAIKALNKNAQTAFYNDTQLFSSPEAAWNAASTMFDRMVKGFSEYLSGQKGGYGEICPFTGRVDVYREVKRERREETRREVYCKGMDLEGHELEKYNATLQEVWSLERFGNPDTSGSVEATFLEETIREEVNPCYVCGPDEIGRWVWNRTESLAGTVNGLSEKSAGESIKNKDATVRLHFNKDDTYTVTVKSASQAGKQTKTIKESAIGMCNTFNRSDPPASEALKLGLEYTFGPFRGTPFDKKLAEKMEVRLPTKEVALDTNEETILRIDFALERPGDT